MMPLPHTVTIKRRQWNDNDTEREVFQGLSTIATAVKALISPGSVGIKDGDAGPIEVERDLIFLEPAPGGTSLTVKVRDILIDDATNEIWIAVGPGNRFQNPTSFGITSPPIEDHIEVEVMRTEWNEP